MRIRMPGLVLSGAILAGALVNTSLFRTDVAAQSDAIWVNVSQGEELLAAMTVQPLRQVRRDEIRPIGAALSMAPRITTVAPTACTCPGYSPRLQYAAQCRRVHAALLPFERHRLRAGGVDQWRRGHRRTRIADADHRAAAGRNARARGGEGTGCGADHS